MDLKERIEEGKTLVQVAKEAAMKTMKSEEEEEEKKEEQEEETEDEDQEEEEDTGDEDQDESEEDNDNEEESDEESSEKDKKPMSRAAKRIRQLVNQRNEYKAMFEELKEELELLRSTINSDGDNTPIGKKDIEEDPRYKMLIDKGYDEDQARDLVEISLMTEKKMSTDKDTPDLDKEIDKAVEALEKVAESEGVELDDDIKELIADRMEEWIDDDDLYPLILKNTNKYMIMAYREVLAELDEPKKKKKPKVQKPKKRSGSSAKIPQEAVNNLSLKQIAKMAAMKNLNK